MLSVSLCLTISLHSLILPSLTMPLSAFFVDLWVQKPIRGRQSDFSFLPFKGPDGHFLPVERMNNCGTAAPLILSTLRQTGKRGMGLCCKKSLSCTPLPFVTFCISLLHQLTKVKQNPASSYTLSHRMNQNINILAKP